MCQLLNHHPCPYFAVCLIILNWINGVYFFSSSVIICMGRVIITAKPASICHLYQNAPSALLILVFFFFFARVCHRLYQNKQENSTQLKISPFVLLSFLRSFVYLDLEYSKAGLNIHFILKNEFDKYILGE